MKSTKGSVSFSGSLGYCPQQAWIQNASLKENVVFWQPFERERYLMALRDCALEQDLKQLPDGDRTMIGERGINLSGGQKQRVNLARVVYFNSDIVLLDDPLSAVDAHVGRYLFENCILGALKDKTRILVTHQLHFLPKVDIVVVMKDGEVAEFGTYAELMASQGEFSVLMRSHGGVDESSASETESAMETDDEIAAAGVAKAKQDKVNLDRLGQALSKESKARTLMSVEERATGSVDIRVWLSYMRAAGNTTFIMGLLIMLILLQAARIGNDMWLVQWTNKRIPNFPDSGYIGVYFAWGISQSLVTYCFGVFFAFASTRAGRVLHKASITRVLRAPVYFFDTTPLGRIINRFSKDQDSMDTQLSDAFRMFSTTLAGTLATFVLIIYATPLFAAPLAPVLVLYYFAQKIYRAVSRELKRLDSLSRSPLYAHVGETLTGLPTIRAYREQNRFVKQNDAMIDTNNAPYYLLFTAQRWMGIRLETLGGLLVFFAATFGILNRTSETLSTALLGLSMSYALEVTQTINWCIRQFTDTEVAMNSVERIEHYAYKIDVEADAIVPSNRPPPGWPQTGEIEVKDLEMKYAPDLPTVLKGVSFNVRDKEKIGVVGRTGSGKSSLMTALFRLTEPTAGSITISGLSTTSIGLRDLRSALAIIPQDPVLFSGSFRTNLDPFSEHTDDELWDALGRANLKGKVVGEKEGLEASVTEGGENLSVGQRQLLCLARAMLKKPRIIILDEATANIDYETDAIIQRSLREDFADATILTIAHRLNTIIDYDRVMVLDAGVIVEYDSPRALLDMEGGRFRAMVEQTGPGNAEMLRSLAK
ncbi:hypothetical protein HK104_001918 [Borealophlyctis nickersoniae]|nr:hypothetical protein HK104_001918 [Borealophlyctis nickersoniae]